jgi:hypothetical protein
MSNLNKKLMDMCYSSQNPVQVYFKICFKTFIPVGCRIPCEEGRQSNILAWLMDMCYSSQNPVQLYFKICLKHDAIMWELWDDGEWNMLVFLMLM